MASEKDVEVEDGVVFVDGNIIIVEDNDIWDDDEKLKQAVIDKDKDVERGDQE